MMQLWGNDPFGITRGTVKQQRKKEVIAAAAAVEEGSRISGDMSTDDGFALENLSIQSRQQTRENQTLMAEEMKEIEEMARNETDNLRIWRNLLLQIMITTGVIVAVLTYIYLVLQRHYEAEETYMVFAQSVQSSTEKKLYDFRSAMLSMAEVVTVAGISSSSSNNRTFPFVRVPMYEVPGSHARKLSGVEYVAWNPIVTQKQRILWSLFVNDQKDWYEESKKLASLTTLDSDTNYDLNSTLRLNIWRGNRSTDADTMFEDAPPGDVFAPIWQCSPPPHSPTFLNYDMLSEQFVRDMLPTLQSTRSGLMSKVDKAFADLPDSFQSKDYQDKFHNQYATDTSDGAVDRPHSAFVQPVYMNLDVHNEHHAGNDGDTTLNSTTSSSTATTMVGFLTSVLAWDAFLGYLLPEGVNGMTAVLDNTCNQSFTYTIDGQQAVFVGQGDLHQKNFRNSAFVFPVLTYDDDAILHATGHCTYSITLYFSQAFVFDPGNHFAAICTLVVMVVFGLMIAVFYVYDHFVHRRNMKIAGAAAQYNAVISSLFPTVVRDRLFAEKQSKRSNAAKLKSAMRKRRKGFDDDVDYNSKPIADLFPETSVMFADIAGFTAWSSVREPCQVFILLETLFRAFDAVAKKRRIFKVETVGDCYVAVAGLPDPRKDHAVAMARFARDCMLLMQSLTQKLEVTLGPDTGDLGMRIGIHSGPVTAGVLRSDRSRFQLFGDTMNTASRMESNGVRNRIQLSQETANLLAAAGKSSWVTEREDVLQVKGKGEMQTYWLDLPDRTLASSTHDTVSSSTWGEDSEGFVPIVVDDRTTRLIKWNVDVLLQLLKQIVARHQARGKQSIPEDQWNHANLMNVTKAAPMDEVKEIITLPKFKGTKKQEDADLVVIDPIVVRQLDDFVTHIASMYRENPFHNFEHASHVTMSVVKLLSRIVAPAELEPQDSSKRCAAAMLHDHTYGITSDPLTQFSCVLSALIHDVDHPGVPNAQLVLEETETAKQYKNKSVAEQNSVDLAWNLLLRPEYTELRKTICSTKDDFNRFRQIIINAVMATDIVDKDLKQLRNQRWDRAFAASTQNVENQDAVNRKATIVIEHLIQASDVSHMMQHWHIYRKWNELFFQECYQAFIDGRAEKNPADSWYEGELGFFDFYIIPLASKLKDCGVFGVSSDEYLIYAVQNRREWEIRGRGLVAEMMERVKKGVNTPKQIRPQVGNRGGQTNESDAPEDETSAFATSNLRARQSFGLGAVDELMDSVNTRYNPGLHQDQQLRKRSEKDRLDM